jgi:hypothetical protein
MPSRVDGLIIAKPCRKDRGNPAGLYRKIMAQKSHKMQDKRNGPANPRDAEPFQFRASRLACATLEESDVARNRESTINSN